MCRQEARQSARTSSGQAKYTDMFKVKCAQRKSQWKLVRVGTFQCGKAAPWKSWGPSKKDLLLHQGSHLIGDFSISWLGPCPRNCKKHFFDCRNLGRRLARTWHNLSKKLKGESGAGTKLADIMQQYATRRQKTKDVEKVLRCFRRAASWWTVSTSAALVSTISARRRQCRCHVDLQLQRQDTTKYNKLLNVWEILYVYIW